VICVPAGAHSDGPGRSHQRPLDGQRTVGVLLWIRAWWRPNLAGGNRELLQNAGHRGLSTVLENARLLEEERAKHQLEEELHLLGPSSQSLLPGKLPSEDGLRARRSSVASHEVGGDYFDVTPVNEHCWCAVVADVSGKGVSSALLASLLQGALIYSVRIPGGPWAAHGAG